MYKRQNTKSNPKVNVLIYLALAYYLLLLIRPLFNTNLSEELSYFRSSLALLIIPICWILSNRASVTKSQVARLQHLFVLSTFALGLFILVYSLVHDFIFYQDYEKIKFIYVHPVYSSLFFITSIIICYFQFPIKTKASRWIQILLIVFFTTLLLFMATRMVLLALFVIVLIELIRFRKKLTKTHLGVLLVSVSLCLAAVIFIKPLNKKVKEVSSFDEFVLPYHPFPTSSQIRLGLYDCAFPLVKKHWLTGQGAHTFEQKLNHCYTKFNNHDSIHYNTHNYYLFLLASSGIFCLLFFLTMMIVQLKRAVKLRDFIYLYILICLLLTLLTENVLSRIQGVLFFMFFMTIFIKTSDETSQE